jgi:hypothetical protein
MLIIWSEVFPDYAERMAAMSHPANIHNAYVAASMMFLEKMWYECLDSGFDCLH